MISCQKYLLIYFNRFFNKVRADEVLISKIITAEIFYKKLKK